MYLAYVASEKEKAELPEKLSALSDQVCVYLYHRD